MIRHSKFATLVFCLLASVVVFPVAADAGAREQDTESISSIDSRFVGHYYLSGIMETGSEMLLKADGTFDWMLVVGGLDLASKGRWARAGNHILLTATPPDNSAPLFTIGKVQAWNEAAEENAQEAAMVQRNNAKMEQCRFLTTEGGEYTDAAMSPPYEPVTPDMILEAKRAVLAEAIVRKTYENAAVAAMASQSDMSHQSAREARLNWRKARDHMRQAQSDARMPFVRLDEPKLPAACALENWPLRPGDIARKDWIGGVAVHIGDSERRMYFNNIAVRFGLESGASLDRVTESGGIAWVPRNLADRVVSVTIIGDEEISKQEYPFTIEPTAEGFIDVNFNSEAFAKPPFNEMALKIDGDDLIGFDGRGRYNRPQSK